MSLTLSGFAQLRKRLTAVQQKAPRTMLQQWQVDTVAEAKMRVPRKTGNLGRSIRRGEITRTYATVKVTESYGPAQELGSGLYGPRHAKYPIVPKNGKVLAWPAAGVKTRLTGAASRSNYGANGRAKSGTFVFARRVMHPGVKPQPFLFPGASAALHKLGVTPIITAWNEAA